MHWPKAGYFMPRVYHGYSRVSIGRMAETRLQEGSQANRDALTSSKYVFGTWQGKNENALPLGQFVSPMTDSVL
jgi:hypothetical protein